MDGSKSRGAWALLGVVGIVLGIFLVLLLGVFFVHGKLGFSDKNNFLASLSNSFSNFLSGEEQIAEVDLDTNSNKISFRPCSYETAGEVSRGSVIFNEISWMGTKENYNAEWMELKNISSLETDISFWQVIDKSERIKITIPKETKIPADGFYLLVRNIPESISGNQTYEGALINTGNGLRLFDSSCKLIDEIPIGKWPAGDNEKKLTMERASDFSWHTSGVSGGTPGGENSNGIFSEFKIQNAKVKIEDQNSESLGIQRSQPASTIYSPVLINEIFVGDDVSSSNEYIELLNPSAQAIDISGWAIKRRSSTGALNSLVSSSRLEGKLISANSFILIANEGGDFVTVADTTWAKSNTLAYENNSVVLINPNGQVVEEVGWAEIPKGESYARGESGAFSVSKRSPKQPN